MVSRRILPALLSLALLCTACQTGTFSVSMKKADGRKPISIKKGHKTMSNLSIPAGLKALTALDALPLLRRGVWLVGTDSHDVTGGNNDGFQALYSYLYKDGDEYVLFEETGPGCIYEIRSIGFKGNLKIYLDGTTSPTLVIPFRDLYNGQRPPFLPPLVAEDETAHGSCWSYYPIPFRSGCKLTTDEMGSPRFFNIFAHKFAVGIEVPELNLSAPTEQALALWSNPEAPSIISPLSEEMRKKVSLPPRKGGTVMDQAGEPGGSAGAREGFRGGTGRRGWRCSEPGW